MTVQLKDIGEEIEYCCYSIENLHPLAAVFGLKKIEEIKSKKEIEIENYIRDKLQKLLKGKILTEDLWETVRMIFLHYDYLEQIRKDMEIRCASILASLPKREPFNKILVLLWFIGDKNELITLYHSYLKNLKSLEFKENNIGMFALMMVLNVIVNAEDIPFFFDVYSNKLALDRLAYIKAVLFVHCPWLYKEYKETIDRHKSNLILNIKNKVTGDFDKLKDEIKKYINDAKGHIEDLRNGTKLREIFYEKINNLEENLKKLEEKIFNESSDNIELFKIYYHAAWLRYTLFFLIMEREWVKEKVNKIIKKLQEYGSLDEEDLAFLYSERLNILDDDIYSKVVGLIIFYRRLKELGISFPYYKTSFDDLRDKIKEMAKDENQKRELSRLVGQIRALKKGKDKWDIEELRRLLDRLSKLGSVIEEFVKPEVIIRY